MDKGTTALEFWTKHANAGCIPVVCHRKGRSIPLSPIPYASAEWKRLYRGRAAVEREFGRLKTLYGLALLRVRGLARVQLHALYSHPVEIGTCPNLGLIHVIPFPVSAAT